MRKLKTLHRDCTATTAVGRASKMSQSGDMMDYGLLCYERGRESMAAERAVVKAAMKWNEAAGAPWEEAEARVTDLEAACDRLLAARKKAGR